MEPGSWVKAKDVLFEAFQRPAGEREGFVRERCSDPELCAAILSLLEASPTTPTEHTWRAQQATPSPFQRADDLKIGTHVGPYEIVGELGRGGMGQVFLGTDPRLQRRVALKCLLDSREKSSDVRTRILHEARAAARLSSQHIAAVHDVVEHDSRVFIVMEYVEGETLAARIKRERLSVNHVIMFGQQLVTALAAAHAEGIIHCDLKPGNVQVTKSGMLKILDFGVASATRLMSTTSLAAASTALGPAPAQQALLVHGGTPPYMSPEQLAGRDLDPRSDIYSLGAILFELSTGRRAFQGTDPFEIALQQAQGAPNAHAVDPKVPGILAKVIARAMSLRASERYQSVFELGSALEAVDTALNRPKLSRGERIRQVAVRGAAGSVIGVLSLLVIGLITTTHFNFVFGRDGQFARFGGEPVVRHLGFGFLAVFPLVVVMLMATAVFMAARYVFGLLELISPVAALSSRVRAGIRAAAVRAGSSRSTTLAQALTGLGIVSLVLFFWHHEALIHAWSSFFNSSPIDQLMPMTDSAPARTEYHRELSVLMLVLGYGLYRVLKLRKDERAHDGRLSVGMLTAVLAIMVFLNILPYRTFHRRDFERVDLAGDRCYIIGETDDEYLVLCPGNQPPRNRTVRRDDPRLKRLGVTENVFKGIGPSTTAP